MLTLNTVELKSVRHKKDGVDQVFTSINHLF